MDGWVWGGVSLSPTRGEIGDGESCKQFQQVNRRQSVTVECGINVGRRQVSSDLPRPSLTAVNSSYLHQFERHLGRVGRTMDILLPSPFCERCFWSYCLHHVSHDRPTISEQDYVCNYHKPRACRGVARNSCLTVSKIQGIGGITFYRDLSTVFTRRIQLPFNQVCSNGEKV